MAEKPRRVAIVGDTHINKLMALLAPGLAVDDKSEFARARGWLWARWLEYIAEFTRLGKGCKKVVVLAGDIGEFDAKQYTNQLVSHDKREIKEMASKTLSPLLDVADEVHVVGGTGAHSGIGCEFERWLADDIGAQFHWLMLAEFAGVLVDIAHYTSAGRTEWTRGNAANKLAAQTIMRYSRSGDRVPQFVFRQHVHHYQDSYDNYGVCRAVIGPCWTFHDEHESGLDLMNSLPDIGGLILNCKNGKGELTAWRREPKRQAILKI
jgi:hypothetical protein